jgi:hypothetical protein
MTKNANTLRELGSVPVSVEQVSPRKPYESPRLQDWGSILELTKGPLSDITDLEIGGSTGV